MEKATDALLYKGSIVEAIAQSRTQKKLFVVYISGEDENSILLEQSTWVNQNVHEVITRCCVFLHLIQGSVDASQFSAIYPQNSVPSISAIGINGVLLWHHEGYINAENLRENIEKSFATLHLQETAATLLTAALATQNPAPIGDASTANASTESGPTSSDTPSTSSSAGTKISDVSPRVGLDKTGDTTSKERSSDTAVISASEGPQKKDVAKVASSGNETLAVKALNHKPVKEKSKPSATTSSEMQEKSKIPKKDIVKSNEVHLNIRMPSGTSLQIKLVKSDALSSVKKFVDEQPDTQANSYNLAVPYPRKLFNEEDMERTLSELGFANRETLIVVPHQSTRSLRAHPASNNSINSSQDSSNATGTGYFGYLRRLLSYVNPFSYLGGNSVSVSPNAPTNNHNSLDGEGGAQASRSSVNTGRRNTSRSFGSNIHTLRNDDDGTDPPRDRNTFWNGNSTQFGSSDQQ